MRLSGKKAMEFLKDVKSGMPDIELQLKYNVSPKLLNLFKAQAKEAMRELRSRSKQPKIQISAQQVLDDIKSGMDDEALMGKYDLTTRQLQRLFRKVIAAGLLSPVELADRLSVTKSQVLEAFEEVGKALDELT